jgi:L,D-peptidoglycan transpeptidase YkuD (ErfK/YbiS/YcfS/YnhG family)
MNIELKNKFLYFEKYKLRCSIGKRGISNKKREGDKKTPKGEFKLKYILYRKDRIINLKTSLRKITIKKNMGWCDDPKSTNYNKIINQPSKSSFEKLWRKENVYDIIIVIDYNLNPVVKNKGSAIFLHIAKRKYRPTNGCIAISKNNIKLLASKINKKTKIKIY